MILWEIVAPFASLATITFALTPHQELPCRERHSFTITFDKSVTSSSAAFTILESTKQKLRPSRSVAESLRETISSTPSSAAQLFVHPSGRYSNQTAKLDYFSLVSERLAIYTESKFRNSGLVSSVVFSWTRRSAVALDSRMLANPGLCS